MKKYIKRLAVISILGLCSTLVLADIDDGDVTIYPGSICKAYHGSNVERVSFSNGHIYASTGLSISCPIVRQDPDSTNLYVGITGTKTGGTMVCTFRDTSYSTQNITYYRSNTVTTSGNYYLAVTIPNTSDYGNYSMYCSLPAGARINQIRVTEAYL